MACAHEPSCLCDCSIESCLSISGDGLSNAESGVGLRDSGVGGIACTLGCLEACLLGVVVAGGGGCEGRKVHNHSDRSVTGGSLCRGCIGDCLCLGDDVGISRCLVGCSGGYARLALLGASRSSVDGRQDSLLGGDAGVDAGDGVSCECTTLGLGAAGLES